MEIANVDNMGWSNHNQQQIIATTQAYDDVFSCSSQMDPLDLSVCFGSNEICEDVAWWDFQHKDQIFVKDLFCSSHVDLAQNHSLVPDFFYCDEQMQNGFVPDPQYQQQLVLLEAKAMEEKKLTGKRPRDEEQNAFSSSKKLSRETISQYFYMPITLAARELNVGLTVLKKRCRELGIRRWPHRKLISLQTLIKNVEEYGKEGLSEEGELREHLRILEQEKRLLEEIPDMEMEDTTKRLRQAFFKANYKKRKLMGAVGSCSTKSQPSKSHNPALMMSDDKVAVDDGDGDKEDEELFRYFLEDCFSL